MTNTKPRIIREFKCETYHEKVLSEAYHAAQEEIKALKTKVAKYEDALRFYSLKSNYSVVDEGRNYSMELVCYELDENTYADVELGTRARQALGEK